MFSVCQLHSDILADEHKHSFAALLQGCILKEHFIDLLVNDPKKLFSKLVEKHDSYDRNTTAILLRTVSIGAIPYKMCFCSI